ncbi:MAG: hypothetical protein C0473_00665 [Cyanobacteria bacterium DS3.002]|nr:hypothetical protein [Cyanobacteria bacterium DS3.002]MBA4075468.1 hypothetical protein [Cyanobacteria bacterium PR.023]
MRLLNVVLSAASLLLAVAPAIASDAAGSSTGASAGASTGAAAIKPASAAVAPAATSATLTPAKKALILELLKMTDADKQVEMIINQLTLSHQRRYPTLLAQAINAAPNLSEEKKKELIATAQEQSARSSERLRQLFMQKIDLSQVMQEVALVVYDKNFTESEMQDIITFYKTPTGKKTLQALPAVMSESMEMTTALITPPLSDIMKQVLQEERERLQGLTTGGKQN